MSASSDACALTRTGAVKCWGLNDFGQIGDGTVGVRYTPVDVVGLRSGVVAIAAGWSHSCALTKGGAVKCWGWNISGQLGDGTTTDRHTPVAVSGLSSGVVAIAAGNSHSCALTGAGVVECWGWNARGELGDGTTTNRLTPTTIPDFAALVRSRTWISTRTLGVGAHALRASYRGDSLHGGSSIRYGHAVVE